LHQPTFSRIPGRPALLAEPYRKSRSSWRYSTASRPSFKNLTAQLDLHLSPLALCRAIKMIASYKVLAYISSVCILRHIARGRCSIIDGNFSPVFSRATSSLRRRFSLPPPIHCNGRLSMKCSFSTLRVSWPSSVITSYTTSNS
jgi:hypothetical protein